MVPVVDFQGREVGIQVIGEKEQILQNQIAATQRLSNKYLLLICSIMVAVACFLMLSVRWLVIRPLNRFQEGLAGFFGFLNHEREDVSPIELTAKDEFGNMATVINANMSKTKELFLREQKIVRAFSLIGIGQLWISHHDRRIDAVGALIVPDVIGSGRGGTDDQRRQQKCSLKHSLPP